MGRRRRKIKQIDSIFDSNVKVGPDYPKGDGPLTVAQLLLQLKDEARKGASFHHEKAIRNEKYFHGIQNRSQHATSQNSEEADGEADSYRNYLRNMVMTWAARFGEDRPIIKAYPTHAEGRDYHAAKLADALLTDVHWREGMDSKLHEASVYAQLHGKIGFKITWDPDRGREQVIEAVDPLDGTPLFNELTGEPEKENLGPQGEVDIEVVSQFGYEYGGAMHAHDAEWVYFTRYESEINAKAMLRERLGSVPPEVSAETYQTSDGRSEEGVEIVDLWYRPSPTIPQGLYAILVGGHVALAEDYPYEHGMLPICEWKVNPLRSSRFATSHVDDAIPVQRLINELEEAKVNTVRKTGVPRLLCTPDIFESFEKGIHMIALDDEQSVQQGAKYLQPPDPSPLIFEHQDEATQGMFDIFGLNEVLVGKDSVKSGTSAKQIAYLSRLDSMKMSGPARHFEVCYIRMARHILSLSRQFMRTDRMVRLMGPGGELSVVALNGADLEGYDVHLEPNSGMDKFRAQAGEEANEDLQRGTATPQEADERAETGLGESMGNAQDRQKAEMMVSRILQGGPPQPDPTINPAVAVKTISRAMGIQPRFDDALRKLAGYYQQLLQQRQMKQAQNPGPENAMGQKPKPQKPKPQGQPTKTQPDEGPGLRQKGPL